MTRLAYALTLAFGLALPAQAMSFDASLPNLTFPEPVTSPSTKGCDTPQDTDNCPVPG